MQRLSIIDCYLDADAISFRNAEPGPHYAPQLSRLTRLSSANPFNNEEPVRSTLDSPSSVDRLHSLAGPASHLSNTTREDNRVSSFSPQPPIQTPSSPLTPTCHTLAVPSRAHSRDDDRTMLDSDEWRSVRSSSSSRRSKHISTFSIGDEGNSFKLGISSHISLFYVH